MRCIDADALIRKFKTASPMAIDGRARQIVKDMPTIEPEPKWIPCTERLPKDGEEVFIYLFGNSPYIAWFEDGEWHTNDFTVDKDDEPIAWMPLPEPYQETEP